LEALIENGVGLAGRFLADWKRQKRALSRPGRRVMMPVPSSATLATGALWAPILGEAAAELAGHLGRPLRVEAIRNETLGETVTVAGLLLGRDVVRQLGRVDLGDLVALPAVMFRGPEGTTLDGMTRG
jgi:NifB/MoaA-like Fe-S oxidoreductase